MHGRQHVQSVVTHSATEATPAVIREERAPSWLERAELRPTPRPCAEWGADGDRAPAWGLAHRSFPGQVSLLGRAPAPRRGAPRLHA